MSEGGGEITNVQILNFSIPINLHRGWPASFGIYFSINKYEKYDICVCIYMKNLLDVRFHGRLQLLVHYLLCFFFPAHYDYLQFVKSIARGKG